MTRRQRQVVQALLHDIGTVRHIATRSGLTATQAYAALRHAEDHGLVRRTDETKRGAHVWQATSKGRQEANQ